jgi:hypothetical protein
MKSITQFITQKLKLRVNETKSAVARPQERKFLGFSFTDGPMIKRAIAPKAPGPCGESRRSHDVQRASASNRRVRPCTHGGVARVSGQPLPLCRSGRVWQRKRPVWCWPGGVEAHFPGLGRGLKIDRHSGPANILISRSERIFFTGPSSLGGLSSACPVQYYVGRIGMAEGCEL